MCSLEARVAQLERSNRRWRVSVLGLLIAGVGLGAQAANVIGTYEVLRTSKIQLTGDVLSFYDKDGEPISGVGSDGGVWCRQLNVTTRDKKDLCSISESRVASEKGRGQIFLYGPGVGSLFVAGNEPFALNQK